MYPRTIETDFEEDEGINGYILLGQDIRNPDFRQKVKLLKGVRSPFAHWFRYIYEQLETTDCLTNRKD